MLLDAAICGKVLVIEYEAKGEKAGRRRIKPVYLYANDGFWYCTAYCYLREGYRVFRCDRIRDAVYDDDASDMMGPLDPGQVRLDRRKAAEPKEPVRLRVELSRVGVQRCEGEHWLAPMLVVGEDGSGTIDTVVSRSDIPFYADFFNSFGNEAMLKEPNELKDAIRSKLSELLVRYR
jgi:predicted DNA-binding transcriptional regulator YafY